MISLPLKLRNREVRKANSVRHGRICFRAERNFGRADRDRRWPESSHAGTAATQGQAQRAEQQRAAQPGGRFGDAAKGL